MSMPEVRGKWIVVDNDVYQRLKDLAKPNETFTETIRRLIETCEADIGSKEEITSTADTKPA